MKKKRKKIPSPSEQFWGHLCFRMTRYWVMKQGGGFPYYTRVEHLIYQVRPTIIMFSLRFEIFTYRQTTDIKWTLLHIGPFVLLKQEAGIQVGDIIVQVNKTDCKWGDHTSVVSLIRKTDASVTIDVVTPVSLKEIAEIYNCKLTKNEQVATSDYGSSVGSESSDSSRNSTLTGVYSLTGSTSSGSASCTASRHSVVLATGNSSILW